MIEKILLFSTPIKSRKNRRFAIEDLVKINSSTKNVIFLLSCIFALILDIEVENLHSLFEHAIHREQADFISDLIIGKPILLPELLEIIFAKEEPVSRRAAWPLRIISQKDKTIVEPFVPEIIDELESMEIVPILKLLLAVLVVTDIPKDYQGQLLQITSEILTNKGSSVASLIYSMDIFFKLSVNEPDLLNELKIMLEQLLPYGSPGVKNKSTKLIKRINRLCGNK